MVRNIFKKEKTAADKVPPVRWPDPPPPLPPTLLQKERERLAEAQKVLNDLQLAVHNQNLVIGHIRENIGLLENNPWFDNLYAELSARQERVGPPIPDFVDSVKRARDAGILDPVKEHGTV